MYYRNKNSVPRQGYRRYKRAPATLPNSAVLSVQTISGPKLIGQQEPRPEKGLQFLTPTSLLAALVIFLIIALPGFTAQAQPKIKDISTDTSSSFFAPPPGITLKQATAIARKHTGGRVLSADPRQRGEVMEYRVRVLIDGERVVTLMVDENGRVRNRR